MRRVTKMGRFLIVSISWRIDNFDIVAGLRFFDIKTNAVKLEAIE